jgi:hypothetical protein
MPDYRDEYRHALIKVNGKVWVPTWSKTRFEDSQQYEEVETSITLQQ